MWLEGITDYRNPTTDTPTNIRTIVDDLKLGILNSTVHGAVALWVQGIPILFSHAGLRPRMSRLLQTEIITQNFNIDFFDNEIEYLAGYINFQLAEAVGPCIHLAACPMLHPIFSAGPERGGLGIGGPFWTDFGVLENISGGKLASRFLQVVGHTIAVNRIRSTPDLSAICIDIGEARMHCMTALWIWLNYVA